MVPPRAPPSSQRSRVSAVALSRAARSAHGRCCLGATPSCQAIAAVGLVQKAGRDSLSAQTAARGRRRRPGRARSPRGRARPALRRRLRRPRLRDRRDDRDARPGACARRRRGGRAQLGRARRRAARLRPLPLPGRTAGAADPVARLDRPLGRGARPARDGARLDRPVPRPADAVAGRGLPSDGDGAPAGGGADARRGPGRRPHPRRPPLAAGARARRDAGRARHPAPGGAG